MTAVRVACPGSLLRDVFDLPPHVNDPDVYRTIARKASNELREKGSRFIAEAYPVTSEEDAEREIEIVRRRDHAATHHCTAYRVGIGRDVFRYNDDGEPSGTAGAPILRQIDRRALTNTLVVVTRYFGGTKLGTGGLARAYGAAASGVLDAAGVTNVGLRTHLEVSFSYDDTAPAMQVIHRFEGRVEASEYAEVTRLRVSVRRSRAAAFRDALTEALRGRGQVALLHE